MTLICRGAHLAAVREHGLQVRSTGGEFTVSQMAASDDPALAGSAEIVIQAVKLYDLGASTRALAPSLGPRSLVVTVQNGVTAADEAGAIVGARSRRAGPRVHQRAPRGARRRRLARPQPDVHHRRS